VALPGETGPEGIGGGAVATATPELLPEDVFGGLERDPPPPFVETMSRPYNPMTPNATMK
jgi:hypothetical protein